MIYLFIVLFVFFMARTGNNVLDKKDNWKMCVAAPPKPVK